MHVWTKENGPDFLRAIHTNADIAAWNFMSTNTQL
jgi:hypothetical protein